MPGTSLAQLKRVRLTFDRGTVVLTQDGDPLDLANSSWRSLGRAGWRPPGSALPLLSARCRAADEGCPVTDETTSYVRAPDEGVLRSCAARLPGDGAAVVARRRLPWRRRSSDRERKDVCRRRRHGAISAAGALPRADAGPPSPVACDAGTTLRRPYRRSWRWATYDRGDHGGDLRERLSNDGAHRQPLRSARR